MPAMFGPIFVTSAACVLLICFTVRARGLHVIAQGSTARERQDAVFLRCDVTDLGPEDEIVRVTWRHNDSRYGAWNDVFTVDLTNDNPAYFFLSQWAGRGQYNPMSLAAIMLSPVYVTRHLAGTYSCQVDGSMSRGQGQATVDIQYGPGTSISISPGGRVVGKEGEETLIACHAHCNPPCTFRWYKSGRRIANTPRLHLTSLTRQDGGLYACQARNHVGRSIKPVEVRVQYPPNVLTLTSLKPEIRSRTAADNKAGEQKSVIKEDILLECRVQAWPKPDIQWLKGSRVMQRSTLSPRISINSSSPDLELTASRLSVRNASCLDNGMYWCVAENSAGSAVKRSVNVSGSCPPLDRSEPEVCPVLSIRRQDPKAWPESLERKIGEEATFGFCFSSHPKARVEVVKGNSTNTTLPSTAVGVVYNERTRVYTVNIAFKIDNPLQYDTYHVRIANSLGSFNKRYNLVSKQPPLPPRNVTIATITSTSICVFWVPSFDGGDEQVFNLTVIELDSESLEGRDDKSKYVKWTVVNDHGHVTGQGLKYRHLHDTGEPNTHSDNVSKSSGSNIDKTSIDNNNDNNNLDKSPTVGYTGRGDDSTLSACFPELSPSTYHSLHVSASNKYGLTQYPDVMVFKTLHPPTTTSTQTADLSVFGANFSPRPESSVTSTVKEENYEPFKEKSRQFDQLPLFDETQEAEVTFTQKSNGKMAVTTESPSAVGEFQSTPVTTSGERNDGGKTGSEKIGGSFFQTQHEIDDSDYEDEDDNDNDDDDDDFSEERRLLHVLFPYFDTILFGQTSSPTTSPIPRTASKPPGTQRTKHSVPFEVERYFKRYASVAKQRHVTVKNPVFTTDDDVLLLTQISTKNFDISTRQTIKIFPVTTSPSTGYSSAVITSSAVVTCVFVIMSAVTVVILLHFRRRRGHNGRHNSQKQHLPCVGTATRVHSAAKTRSNSTQHGGNTPQNSLSTTSRVSLPHIPKSKVMANQSGGNPIKKSPSKSKKHLAPAPQMPGVMTNSKNNKLNGVVGGRSNISFRPRLSTPTLSKKETRQQYNNNKNNNNNSTNTRERTKNLPACSGNATPTPSFSKHSGISVLQVPGISVNDKRISSPSYLEIAVVGNSRLETSGSDPRLVNCLGDSDTVSDSYLNPAALHSRKSSYSSVRDALHTTDGSGILELGRYNSYLDLVEALSAKSGSRSPSNIYDPLDLYEKTSINSSVSYMGPGTPEMTKKALEFEGESLHSWNKLQNIQKHHHQHHQQQHFLEKHQLQQRLLQQKLQQNTSSLSSKNIKNQLHAFDHDQGDVKREDSFHYEDCVSFVCVKDNNRRSISPARDTGEETAKSTKITKTKSKSPSSTEFSYMNYDKKHGGRCGTKKSSTDSPDLIACENMASVYNEINDDSVVKEEENDTTHSDDVNHGCALRHQDKHDVIDTSQEGQRHQGCEEEEDNVYYKNHRKLKNQSSPLATIKALKQQMNRNQPIIKAEANTKIFSQNQTTTRTNQTQVQDSAVPGMSSCGRAADSSNSNTQTAATGKGQGERAATPPGHSYKGEAVSRQPSSHYYSDID